MWNSVSNKLQRPPESADLEVLLQLKRGTILKTLSRIHVNPGAVIKRDILISMLCICLIIEIVKKSSVPVLVLANRFSGQPDLSPGA
jgi:hypothetical protein